jgi:glyoxylase-like metal-dependent hydrolase (beta-lactamase superfamily II)
MSSSIRRVHHLSSGILCPPGGRLLNRSPARVACHCLLVELDSTLILIDTGVGLEDMDDPSRLGPMSHLLGLRREPADTAVRQVEGLGFRREDIEHIVVTHLDLDHAGGLPDFPEARVHVLDVEHHAALTPRTLRERERYRTCHFRHGPRWAIHEDSTGEPWFGCAALRPDHGLPPEIVLVPLIGHTRGHCGVAVRTSSGWLFHGGDIYYHHDEMASRSRCSPGFTLFRYLAHHDVGAARESRERLREVALRHPKEVTLFCAHDPGEFEELSGTVLFG